MNRVTALLALASSWCLAVAIVVKTGAVTPLAAETIVPPPQTQAAALSMQAYREGARDLSSALVAERDLATARAELNDARAQAALAYADLVIAAGEDHAP